MLVANHLSEMSDALLDGTSCWLQGNESCVSGLGKWRSHQLRGHADQLDGVRGRDVLEGDTQRTSRPGPKDARAHQSTLPIIIDAESHVVVAGAREF